MKNFSLCLFIIALFAFNNLCLNAIKVSNNSNNSSNNNKSNIAGLDKNKLTKYINNVNNNNSKSSNSHSNQNHLSKISAQSIIQMIGGKNKSQEKTENNSLITKRSSIKNLTTKNFLTNREANNSNSNNDNNSKNNRLSSHYNQSKEVTKATENESNQIPQDPIDLTINNNELLTSTESTKTILSDWLRIYSPSYKNQKLFPSISLPNYTTKQILLDEETSFRINDKFSTDSDYFKRYQFFFRLSVKNIYYSVDKDSLTILDSLPIKRISSITNFDITDTENSLCFQINDSEGSSQWKLCSMSIKANKTWYCAIKNLINQIDQECKIRIEDETPPTIIDQNITQPILLIPQPSKQCNENWNYIKKGTDWECECVEGKEQSPIDLPSKENAIPSPVKPIFQYEEIGPKELITTKEGEKKSVNINFSYKENMLNIDSFSGFGKLITLDGRIYKASKIVFHTPSEHTIEGKQFDMEMQIIHSGVTHGDLAKHVVVSVLFTKKAGVYNRFIEKLDFFNLPNVVYSDVDVNSSLYLPDVLFSSDSDDVSIMKPVSFYTYKGSLSAPPCSENTINYVLAKPIELSTTALQLFKEAIRIPDYRDVSNGNIYVNKEKAENNRAVQENNGRQVFYYDHVKYCGAEPEKSKSFEKVDGHYEKVKSSITQYVYVNSEKPSGMPNSFVVSEDVAKGTASEIN